MVWRIAARRASEFAVVSCEPAEVSAQCGDDLLAFRGELFLATSTHPVGFLLRLDPELVDDGGDLRVGDRTVKKLPTLRGRTVVNLFFEDSTRTRTSSRPPTH